MIKSFLSAAVAGAAAIGFAVAAPVTGEAVTADFDNGSFVFNGTVQAGSDFGVIGNGLEIDVDAGAERDRVIFTSLENFNGGVGASTVDFTLPLAMGDTIVGASVISSQVASIATSFSMNVLTVSWIDSNPLVPGVIFEIDVDYAGAEVPVPAAALLFAPAALLAARRSKAA